MKEARTIKLESGYEAPEGKRQLAGDLALLRKAFRDMDPAKAQSFMWRNNKGPYDAAKQLGIRIATRKVNGEGYRVWRIS